MSYSEYLPEENVKSSNIGFEKVKRCNSSVGINMNAKCICARVPDNCSLFSSAFTVSALCLPQYPLKLFPVLLLLCFVLCFAGMWSEISVSAFFRCMDAEMKSEGMQM